MQNKRKLYMSNYNNAKTLRFLYKRKIVFLILNFRFNKLIIFLKLIDSLEINKKAR